MYSNATAWLAHQQQPIHEQQHVQHDGQPSSADAWKDRNGVASSSHQTLDLSDFGLGDIPGEHVSLSAQVYTVQPRDLTADACSNTLHDVGDTTNTEADAHLTVPSTSTSPPPQPYFHNFQQQNFYVPPNGQQPFNSMAFGPTSWPSQQSTVPLSNYSSLNGATSQPPPSQPQQQSPPLPQMMIE